MGLVPSPTVLSVDEMGRIAPPIFTSVGRGGANAPGDVFVIQSLLNDRLPKPHAPIPVNGVADVGTTLAIEAYQAVIMQMTPPSGRVDPGSSTYYALAARPLVANALPTSVGHFGEIPSDVASAAVASRLRWTVPASVTVAQWAVESAWGASMPPGSNNPFGIKAKPGQEGVYAATHEQKGGRLVATHATFAKYPSLTAAFEAHAQLVSKAPAYQKAMEHIADTTGFVKALSRRYATDKHYASKILNIIRHQEMNSV